MIFPVGSDLSVGQVLYTVLYLDDGDSTLEMFLENPVPPSYILGTENLFMLDSSKPFYIFHVNESSNTLWVINVLDFC